MSKINAGIFAAGKGERLKKNFPNTPKPLIKVLNKALIELALNNLYNLNPQNICVLLNNENFRPVINYLGSNRLNFIAVNSKTSFESFFTLASFLNDGISNIVLSTVDVITNPSNIKNSVEFHIKTDSYLTLGISDIPPDEKPLLVESDKDSKVISIGKAGRFATNGIYIISPKLIDVIMIKKYKALREFLSDIDLSKYKVSSFYFADSFDVDDETDIKKAEDFLRDLRPIDQKDKLP